MQPAWSREPSQQVVLGSAQLFVFLSESIRLMSWKAVGPNHLTHPYHGRLTSLVPKSHFQGQPWVLCHTQVETFMTLRTGVVPRPLVLAVWFADRLWLRFSLCCCILGWPSRRVGSSLREQSRKRLSEDKDMLKTQLFSSNSEVQAPKNNCLGSLLPTSTSSHPKSTSDRRGDRSQMRGSRSNRW